MTNKTAELFNYINQTLSLIQSDFLKETTGNSIIKKIEPLFENKKELYSHMAYLKEEHLNYWFNFLFNEDEHVVGYLKELSVKDWHNQKLLEKLTSKFLNLSDNIKKDFYSINMTEHKKDSKHNISYVFIGAKSIPSADIHSFYHNLPTIFLQSSRWDVNYPLFEDICNDVKKTMQLSHHEFLNIYGTALIHCLEPKYILKNWDNYQIKNRPQLQEAFATKFFQHNRLKDGTDKFLAYVENGLLPYDVRLPRTRHYVMNIAIHHCLNNAVSQLSVQPFKVEKFCAATEETKTKISKLNSQYDLYFFNPETIKLKAQEMNKIYEQRFLKDESKSIIERQILDFSLSLENLFKKKEEKLSKKMKI